MRFVADVTLPDGIFLPAGSRQRKVWRLEEPISVASLSLVREFQGVLLHHDKTFNEDGTFDVAIEFEVPLLSASYRYHFRLVREREDDEHLGEQQTVGDRWIPVGDALWIDFCVAVPGDERDRQGVLQQAALAERQRHGPSMVRSWTHDEEHSLGATLVIAFAGADANIGGAGIAGGVPSFEFANAFRRAGVDRALFVRDALRSWYLRGIGDAGHDFESVVRVLEREIETVQPSRVITVGCSMGGYAAVRAGLALRAQTILAFGPQVVLEPIERSRLGLPESSFDSLLDSLAANGKAEGFALTSLMEVARGDLASQQPQPQPPQSQLRSPSSTDSRRAHAHIHVELFAGANCEGDVREANLLQQAIAAMRHHREALNHSSGPCIQPAVTCRCTVHPGSDHAIAAAMRASGELHDVLCRAVRAGVAGEQAVGCTRVRGTSSTGGASGTLPTCFDGFADCPDF